MRKVIKSLYGNVALLKCYCPLCKRYSFIQDGRLVCCNYSFEEIPEREIKKRESEGRNRRYPIPERIKRAVLEEQNHRCIYCGCDLNGYAWNDRKGKYIKLKIQCDHFIAWNYSRNNSDHNIVISCHVCNAIKGDKYFPDLIGAKEYILKKRVSKGFKERLTLENEP